MARMETINKLREFMGMLKDEAGRDAYDRYLEHHKAHHPDQEPLDRKTFFEQHLQNKWNNINKCC